MRNAALLFCLLLCPWPASADSGLSVYSFGDIFVFDTVTGGGRNLNIVVMDDKRELKVSSTVYLDKDYNVQAYENFNNYLIALVWNEVFVIDLSVPGKPLQVKRYKPAEHEPRPGEGRIVRDGNVFTILSTRVTAALAADGDINKWVLTDMARTRELEERTRAQPRFPAFNSGLRDMSPFLVRETADYKYKLRWKRVRKGRFGFEYSKYLVKAGVKNDAPVSLLLLGRILETGGD